MDTIARLGLIPKIATTHSLQNAIRQQDGSSNSAPEGLVVTLSAEAKTLTASEPEQGQAFLPTEALKDMSFSELIAERDKNMLSLTKEPRNPNRSYSGYATSPASDKILRIVHEQDFTTSQARVSLHNAMSDFKTLVSETMPQLTQDYDITMQDGKLTVVSEVLVPEDIAKLQALLNDSDHDKVKELQTAIDNFNKEALKLINYTIEDKGNWAYGLDAQRARRDQALTMETFIDSISYMKEAALGAPPKRPPGMPPEVSWGGAMLSELHLLAEYKFLSTP